MNDGEHPKHDAGASSTSANGGDDLASRVTTLEADLAAAREEAKQAHDRWLRERADLENVKRRTTREKQDALRFGAEALARDLLPVVDNLERALAHAGAGSDAAALAQGVELVLKSFRDVLERHGITRVPAAGTTFDPAHHEAVAHVPSTEHPQGAVVEEHQAGYRLHDRLLRPAMVSVSKGAAGGTKLAPHEGGD
jgi:molecular chaperone GrpE